MPTKLRSWTTIDEDAQRLMADLQPGDMIPIEAMITPGEMLRLDYLEPMGVTPTQLARAIGVQPSYISKVLHGGGISPELGLLLDKYFGMSQGFFYRIQASYDTSVSNFKLAEKLAQVEPLVQKAA